MAKTPPSDKRKYPQRDYKNVVGYRFYDRDPELDFVVAALLNSPKTLAQIERESGVSAGTMRRWINNEVKRPNKLTMQFALKCASPYAYGIYNRETGVIIDIEKHQRSQKLRVVR